MAAKSIAVRIRERCKGFDTVCILPVEEAREAATALAGLEASLIYLTRQIAETAPKDELGHDFRMNDAQLKRLRCCIGSRAHDTLEGPVHPWGRAGTIASQVASMEEPTTRLIHCNPNDNETKTCAPNRFVESSACKSRSNNPSLKRPISLAAPEQNCGS